MSFLSSIFSGGAKEIVGGASQIIDQLTVSDEEKSSAKAKLTEIVQTNLNELYATQASVINSEAKGGFLQRNWRPITMLVFVFIIANNYVLFPYLQLFFSTGVMLDIPPDMWGLLKIGMGGYIAGRSMEKLSENVTKNIDLSFLKKKDRKEIIKVQ